MLIQTIRRKMKKMKDNYFLISSEFSIKAIKKFKITDTYSWHRTIYGMFDKNHDDNNYSSRILWTLAKSNSPLSQTVYILSDRPVSEKTDDVIKYKTTCIPQKLFEFDRYSFSVVVNPVKRYDGKVVPVKGRENIINWFVQLAQKNGFSVIEKGLTLDKVFVDKFKDKQMNEMFIQKAFFSGTLSVTDRELFKKAVTLGIGRAKTYGCGLLQIVPVID